MSDPGVMMVPVYTRADVENLVGAAAFARAEAYAAEGRVISIARGHGGSTLVGHVREQSGRQYVAVVTMSGAGPEARPRSGTCSCPVRLVCKHAGAVLLAALDRDEGTGLVPGPPSAPLAEWERTFATLLDDDAPEAGRLPAAAARRERWAAEHDVPVALQLDLGPPEQRPAGPFGGGRRADALRLGLRPVVRGKNGRWVRTGISWRELRHLRGRASSEHLTVLQSLYALASAGSQSSYYFDAPVWLDAGTMPGAALAAVLGDARRVGLPLVESAAAQRPVELATEVVHVRLDVTADGDGLTLDARLVVEDPYLLIGQPPALIVSRQASTLTGKGPLRLAPLERPLDELVASLVARGTALDVPASGVHQMLTRVLPALRERITNVVLDPGVVVPAPPRPRLWLEVTRLPGHVTDLAWQWRYSSGPDAPDDLRMPFGDTGAAPASGPARSHVRDLEAESEIAERLGRDLHGLAAGNRTLVGIDTARFFAEEMPGLNTVAARESDFGIDVVVGHDVDADIAYEHTEDVDVRIEVAQEVGGHDWFDLGVVVHAAGRQVPFSLVFTALAEGRKRLMLDRGLYFSLKGERFDDLRALIDESRSLQDTMGGTLRVSRYQAGLFDELERLGLLDGQVSAWRAALGALTDGSVPQPLEPPAGLEATLRPYQQAGFEWIEHLRIHGLGGVLADDMGLGKTIQALAVVQRVREEEARVALETGEPAARAPFLVVVPTSLVGNWVAEARRFTPGLTVVALGETKARRRTSLDHAIAEADVVVTTYAVFRLDYEDFADQTWAGLILDEAHTVKNHQSAAYRCARSLDVPFKLAMTGTPMENNLMELWSILSIASPGLFPHPRLFREHYADPIEKSGSGERLALLRRRIGPFMLRRTKDLVASELPPKQEQVMEVELNSRHRALYQGYLQRERVNVLGLVDDLDAHRFEVFRSLAVLRQAALDVSLVDPEHAGVPSSKLDVLLGMLEDILAEGHSVLIFSQFTRYLGKVRDALDARGVTYAYLDGRTKRRTEQVERFTSGEVPVFLISLKAGGVGLNLAAADYCILLDPWWNPAAEAQAVDRAHRIGQERTVMVYRFVATDTIEEKVMALKESKLKLFTSVVDGGAAGGRGLTAADVRSLLG